MSLQQRNFLEGSVETLLTAFSRVVKSEFHLPVHQRFLFWDTDVTRFITSYIARLEEILQPGTFSYREFNTDIPEGPVYFWSRSITAVTSHQQILVHLEDLVLYYIRLGFVHLRRVEENLRYHLITSINSGSHPTNDTTDNIRDRPQVIHRSQSW